MNSALHQSYKKPYEIIVVDSSDDGTDKLIKSVFPFLKLVHLNKKTLPGPARNIGAREAQSVYVAFIDTDCIADYQWIENIMQRMKISDYDSVGGVIQNGTSKSISGTLGYLNEFSFSVPGTKSGSVTAIATANVCYKREIFNDLQFSDFHFAGEDTAFHWSILDMGGKLFFDNNIKITHINRMGFLNVLRHQKKMGEGAAVARIQMKKDLFLIQNPIISILILPVIRLFNMYLRLFKADKILFLKNSIFAPISFIIALSWSAGFFSMARKHKG